MDIAIKGYEIDCKIGQGGMAEVYRARHLRLDREIALKVLLPRYSQEPGFADRFLREARIAAKLNHPYIVQIYDVDNSDGQLFLAMELITGGDLAQKLTQKPNKEFALKVFVQLCTALDYAHQKGYVHRDIKPANILFRDDENLALSDFGIARAMHSDTNMTSTGLVIGTPSYMSPEQAQSYTLDGRADLYSAAVIAYQFVTGQLPYQADSSISLAIKHINEPIPVLPQHLAPMQLFFNRALAKKPSDRFDTGEIFVTAFAEALNNVKSLEYATDTTRVLVQGASHTLTMVREDENNDKETTPSIKDKASRVHPANANLSKRFKPYAIAAVTVLVFFGLVYSLLNSDILAPQVQLSPGEQARMAQLLNAADNALAADKLVMPQGDNAYEYFQAILALSPADPIALTGIDQVEAQLSIQSQQALDNSDLDEADNLLTQLRLIDTNSEKVRSLQQAVEAGRQQQLQLTLATLAAAEQQLQSGNLDSAADEFFKAKTLPLTNNQISEMNQQIEVQVSDNLNRAKAASANNDFERAYTELEQAKKLAALLPQSNLIQQIDQLNSETAAKENRRARDQRIQELVRAGDAALAEGKLLAPVSQSAWYYYQQVLQRDPANENASSGQQKVKQTLISNIDSAINLGDIPLANNAIAELTQLDARHVELPRLQRALKVKQRDIARTQSVQVKIDELYVRAQRYLDANRADGADKIWRDIESLSPNDPGLKPLGAKIADGYVALAQREYDARDWSDVNVWVDRGLKHVPDHKQLLELRAMAAAKLQR